MQAEKESMEAAAEEEVRGEAEAACRELLERNAQDVQALCTYAALLTELNRPEESRALAERLARIPPEDPDEMYKVATVCCENGL